MAWRSVASLSLYMQSYVRIICIYPIMHDDQMRRSVQAKFCLLLALVHHFNQLFGITGVAYDAALLPFRGTE